MTLSSPLTHVLGVRGGLSVSGVFIGRVVVCTFKKAGRYIEQTNIHAEINEPKSCSCATVSISHSVKAQGADLTCHRSVKCSQQRHNLKGKSNQMMHICLQHATLSKCENQEKTSRVVSLRISQGFITQQQRHSHLEMKPIRIMLFCLGVDKKEREIWKLTVIGCDSSSTEAAETTQYLTCTLPGLQILGLVALCSLSQELWERCQNKTL